MSRVSRTLQEKRLLSSRCQQSTNAVNPQTGSLRGNHLHFNRVVLTKTSPHLPDKATVTIMAEDPSGIEPNRTQRENQTLVRGEVNEEPLTPLSPRGVIDDHVHHTKSPGAKALNEQHVGSPGERASRRVWHERMVRFPPESKLDSQMRERNSVDLKVDYFVDWVDFLGTYSSRKKSFSSFSHPSSFQNTVPS